MRCVAWIVASLSAVFPLGASAEARVIIQVDLTSQSMHVSSASGDYEWPISSARSGYRTPRGSFGVQSLQAMHHSRKYHNSPMPHSIFFAGGYAIHGTSSTGALGSPASHGCVRIAPDNAAALFQMVRTEGARISITGTAPVTEMRYARRAAGRIYASRHRERGYIQQRYEDQDVYDTPRALGYAAPVVAPGFDQWLADPSGY